MNVQQQELYQRLQAFSLDEPNAKYSFSKRLARENGWTVEYTQQAIAEYKKFAFLAVVAEHPVTPSEQVDQVWHLHLAYTRSYWDEFCPNILQKPLHHSPTQGGSSEDNKFNHWYNKTLEEYTTFFGEFPPVEIWPPAEIRFNHDIQVQRVNTEDYWIIPKFRNLNLPVFRFPKPAILGIGFLLTLALTACEVSLTNMQNPLDFTGSEFLEFYFLSVLTAIVLGLGLDSLRKPSTATSSTHRKSLFIEYLPALPIFAVLALGVAKIFVSISRGKPIGYLFFLCIFTLCIAICFLPSSQSSSRSSSRSGNKSSNSSSSYHSTNSSSYYDSSSSNSGYGSDGGSDCSSSYHSTSSSSDSSCGSDGGGGGGDCGGGGCGGGCGGGGCCGGA
ncbi:hypothetical protein [Lyngbya sp. PCC 8106]|uniref:glycine-rich domain-containing protein n=1 Tax=Lyngbya sp. (strain PCC 8106) TaxID=313612 RepID=UPI0012E9E1E0|nr:hypothetical protein [Lyngbya sp. PCC 8106]